MNCWETFIIVTENGVNRAFNNVKIHKDRTLWFDFVGGEALLDYKFVKELVDYILKMNEGENYNLQFSLTTNGTLLTENIVDWLAENKFSLKIKP